MDRVVPVAVKAMPLEAYRRQLRIGDGDATRVLAAVEFRPNAESGPTVRRANEAHDRGQVDEWGAAPIHRDVREQPMLDLVPLARTRRKVTDRDHQARPIGQTLQFPLPQPEARPVAPACIRRDQQRLGLSIRRATHVLPPTLDRPYREARGVVIDPDTHPAFVAMQIVDAIRNGLPRPWWRWPGSRSRGPVPAAASSPGARCGPRS